MYHILELFHSEHYEDILDVEIHMLQDLLVVALLSIFNIVSTMLFHKYVGANVVVTNCMLYFSILVTTKFTVKMTNENTGHVQLIGTILCCFPTC